ncbi:hypothetical protein HispidOSU_005194 [Sigmodon hispidus]
MAARRPLWALSPTSVLQAGEDKEPSGRRIPPVVLAALPLDKLALQIPAVPSDSPPTVPTDSEHTGCDARGRATLGTGDSGFWPDASKKRSRLGGARPAELYLLSLTPAVQLAQSPFPAAPPLLAALIEIQPEPLASAAPAATGPAQATAATPLTTASATPPTKGTPLLIG